MASRKSEGGGARKQARKSNPNAVTRILTHSTYTILLHPESNDERAHWYGYEDGHCVAGPWVSEGRGEKWREKMEIVEKGE